MPVTPVVGEFGLVIAPVPESKVHTPVPTLGVLAIKVAVVEQIVCVTVVIIALGIAETTIATVEVDGGHAPLEMLHWKMLVPTPKPLIEEFGEFGEAIVPEPEINDQVPFPTLGVFPARVAVLAHMVCEIPANETVGDGSRIMQVVAVEIQPGLIIDHRKTFVPVEIPVTPVVGWLGDVMTPVPLNNVQVPVPIDGGFAFKVVAEVQIFWHGPVIAGEIAGGVIVIVLTTGILEPELFDETSVIVYMPAVLYVVIGFFIVLSEGVAPANVYDHEVGRLFDKSITTTLEP
jgi:hypothetical protein